jgi:diguanylate cyclase (GGDEF)-like protein
LIRVAAEKDKMHILAGSAVEPGAILMYHPLIVKDHYSGLLAVVLDKELVDDEQVRRSIQLAVNLLENNLILQSELEVMHTENAFLSDLVQRAGSLDISATSEALIATLVRLVKGVLTFDRLTISLESTEGQDKLRIEWVEGSEESPQPGFTFDATGVVHGEVYGQAQAMNFGTLEESGYEGRFEAGDIKGTQLTSFAGVPLMEAGIPKGTIALESRAKDHFSSRDLEILHAIVQVYGTALCWTQRYQEVHAMATVDGLTQLLNHRSFMERFEEELERATRYGETMTFLMLDLDHFKQVNDSYGHLHGDYVLWQTAQLLRSCIRKPDIAGRYGGEEFGVIIINASKRDSLTTAERVRSSIAEYQFENDGIQNRISVSIGMSEYPADGQDTNTLVQRADEAMYAVKRQGGNAVISYTEEMDHAEEKEE